MRVLHKLRSRLVAELLVWLGEGWLPHHEGGGSFQKPAEGALNLTATMTGYD